MHAIAEEVKSSTAKVLMLRLARDYEWLAEWAENDRAHQGRESTSN
jgi:hypothetical protein